MSFKCTESDPPKNFTHFPSPEFLDFRDHFKNISHLDKFQNPENFFLRKNSQEFLQNIFAKNFFLFISKLQNTMKMFQNHQKS